MRLAHFQHALAFRREAKESGAAADKHGAQLVLQLLDSLRERRLGYATSLSGLTEVLLACDGDQVIEFLDHGLG